MDNFWIVTLFHLQLPSGQLESIEALAVSEFGAMGIEEFSLDEAQVDELLGDRSYSGGDLPLEILEEVETHMSLRPGNYRFFFSDSASASNFKQEIAGELLCEVQIEECPQQDWNAQWKKHYSPIKVNQALEVIPSWQQDFNSSAAKQIFIYPGMGFGTGSHETTFLCLKLFTEELLSHNLERILDFGSGSGILGLSSLLFFPQAELDFYDIDPEANKNCFHNAEVNKLTDTKFRLLLPEVRQLLRPNYQLVFANILESILLAEKENLIAKTEAGGHLILSGLLTHQASGVITSYVQAGLTLIRQEYKGDWAALLFRKASP